MKFKSFLPLYLSILAGMIVSALLQKTHIDINYGLESLGICSISKDYSCRAVINSPYSYFLGIPLANLGTAYYIILFFIVAFSVRRNNSSFCLVAWLSTLSLLVSVVLFIISKFILNSICPLCLITYLINISIFILLFFYRHRKSIKFSYKNLYTELKSFFRELRYIIRFIIFSFLAIGFPVLLDFIFVRQAEIAKLSQLKLPWEKQYLLNSIDANAFYLYGNKNAKIKIVEFADFECYPCRRMSGILEKIISEYPEQIALIYKNFPWNKECNSNVEVLMHPYACDATIFSICAGLQGKYWESNKSLMKFDWEMRLTKDKFQDFIKENIIALGLNKDKYFSCATTKQYQSILTAQLVEARRLNVKGTPTIFINGRLVERPDEFNLRSIIKDILNEN